jgi:hypothetical protein
VACAVGGVHRGGREQRKHMTTQTASPAPPSDAVDELKRALDHFRPKLDRALPIAARARNFWAIVVAVRDLAAADVVRQDLTDLLRSTGLVADLGRHGPEDIEHLIRWGMLKRDPFGRRRVRP